jgi:hypothetical protein
MGVVMMDLVAAVVAIARGIPLWAGLCSLCLLSAAARAEEATEPEDSASRAEKILRIVQAGLGPASSREPSVLGDIDPRMASPHVKEAFRALRGTKADFALEKQPLSAVLELFQSLAGVPFVMSAKARKACQEQTVEVDLNLKGVSLENALNLLALQLDGYRFTVRYGGVVLVRAEEYKPQKVLRVYSIHDLIHVPPDFPAPQLALEPRK